MTKRHEMKNIELGRTPDDWFPGVIAACYRCGVTVNVAGCAADGRNKPGHPAIRYYCDKCADEITAQDNES